ncbi:CAP domain-containing protein [Halosimplex aquaticum]
MARGARAAAVREPRRAPRRATRRDGDGPQRRHGRPGRDDPPDRQPLKRAALPRRLLFETCKFKKSGAQYVVTPTRNRLEVLGKTYAGRAYETANGTRYNGDERAVAAAVFESWVETGPYRDRLSYANATRIGIGIETTEDNEVYVTGDLCGVYGSS